MVSPICPVNNDMEDTEYFLLLHNSFIEHALLVLHEHRRNLLTGVSVVLEPYEYSDASDINVLQHLLYGSKDLHSNVYMLISNFITCIWETNRCV